MLKYFLEEEQQQPTENVHEIIKTHLIHKREYKPFHLDCQYSKKKLCYCPAFPVSNLPKASRVKIWKSYQPVHDLYTQVDEPQVQRAAKLVNFCIN